MKFLAVACVLLQASMVDAQSESFDDWSARHGKRYSQEERPLRRRTFDENANHIAMSNADNTRPFKLALNQFADLTFEEFRARFLGGLRVPPEATGDAHRELGGTKVSSTPTSTRSASPSPQAPSATPTQTKSPASPSASPSPSRPATPTRTASASPPGNVDWAVAGYVAPVRNQGQCGSCWAFSAQAAIESAVAIKAGVPNSVPDLSEQQCVDCVGSAYGCYQCNGGWMTGVYRYNIDTAGSCTEQDYPYTATQSTTGCRTCATKTARLSGYVEPTKNSRSALMAAVQRQPVAVAVQAGGREFQFYSSGVLTTTCGSNVDHAVLLVGYGTASTGGDYWRIKNSWGTSWGEAGYMRLARGSKYDPAGQCGIQTNPSYPTAL